MASNKVMDLREYHFDFGAIFDNGECRGWYADYLKQVKSEESLLFVESVERYEALKSDKNRYYEALKIIDNFIRSSSKWEVNIDDEVRTIILRRFELLCGDISEENCPKNLFETVCYRVFLDLKSDTFKRFVESETFYNRVINKLKQDTSFLTTIAKKKSIGRGSSVELTTYGSSISDSELFIIEVAQHAREEICKVAAKDEDSDSDNVISDAYSFYNLNDEQAKLDQFYSLDTLFGSSPVITQFDQDKVLQLCMENESMWKCLTNKKDRWLHISKEKFHFGTSNRKIRAYKESGIMPFSAEHVVNFLFEKKLHHLAEPMLKEYENLDYIPYQKGSNLEAFPMSVVYMKFKMTPMQSRGFLYATSSLYDSKNKRYIIIRKTCDHPKMPARDKKSKTVRATYYGGVIVEPIDDKSSRYTVAAIVDFAGWLPLPVWNTLLGLRDDTFHNGMFKALDIKKKRGTLSKVEDNGIRLLDTFEENRIRLMTNM